MAFLAPAIPEAVALGAEALLPGAEALLPEAEAVGSKAFSKAEQMIGQKAVQTGEKVASKETKQKLLEQIAKNTAPAPKEGWLQKLKHTITDPTQILFLGGPLLLGGLASGSSSSTNPTVSNKELIEAHHKAKGSKKAFENTKLSNGKTVKQVQKDFIVENKKQIKQALKDRSKLYKKNGQPTDLHKKAIIHGLQFE